MASIDFEAILAAASHHYNQNRPFFPMYLHLIGSALFPIYTGAYASLSRPSSAAKPIKSKDNVDGDEDEEEEMDQKMEGLTPTDAVVFPITAGIVLASLYWLIKKYGADVINTFLGLYFSIIGTYSVGKLINDSWAIMSGFITPDYYQSGGKLWRLDDKQRKAVVVGSGNADTDSRRSPLAGGLGGIPLPQVLLDLAWQFRALSKQRFTVKGYAKGLMEFSVALTRHNVISALLGLVAIAYSLFIDKPWFLTNLQGFAVCYGALQLMSPTTFATGTLILSGLFCYDIWAVFFTPLMVTVATELDVPIKLVFPRPGQEGKKPSFSMLGLGDIVLPGIMIALALRFDLYMFYLRKQKKVAKKSDRSKDGEETAEIEKAPYVPVSGNWGERILTAGYRGDSLPASLSAAFPKPYFTASMVGYIIGMVATLVFMSVFQHAQPALLYLVPGVLISLWSTGLARGELSEMWEYTEAITGEPLDDNKEPKKDEGKETASPDESLFSWLWKSVFGDSDKKEQSAKKDKSDKIEDKKTKTSAAKASSEDTKKSQTTDGPIFSFTISHYVPKTATKSVETAMPKSGAQVPEADSDDAVLVSRSDADVSEKRRSTRSCKAKSEDASEAE